MQLKKKIIIEIDCARCSDFYKFYWIISW